MQHHAGEGESAMSGFQHVHMALTLDELLTPIGHLNLLHDNLTQDIGM